MQNRHMMVTDTNEGLAPVEFVRDYGRFRSLLGDLAWKIYGDEIVGAVQREYKLRGFNARTTVYALDAYGFSEKLEKLILDEKSVKVFFVINLTKSSAPYLKCADFLIFLNPDQCRLYDILYQHTKPSKILRLKQKTPKGVHETGGLAVLLAWHYRPYGYPRLAKRISEVIAYYYNHVDIGSINIVCQSPLIKSKKLLGHLEMATGKPVNILDVRNIDEADRVLTECEYAEVIDFGDFEDPFRIMSNPDMRFEIRSIDYDIPSYMLPLIAASYGCESLSNATCKQYIPKPYYEGNELGEVSKGALEQAPDPVNIAYGEPLGNQFVLSILFRNVGNKLERCIRSVINTRLHYDVGIVLVDDCSDDGAVKSAISTIEQAGIPACVVINSERRYAAHNYYAVINELVVNDDSVIIDLDGDDLLNQDVDVFGELAAVYSSGDVLKTFGSFKTLVEDADKDVGGTSKQIYMKIFQGYQLLNDASTPYNQFRCQSWMHLRSAKRGLLRRVEICHFKNRSTGSWLRTDHDASVNSRAIELAGYSNVRYLDKPLYIYDITGEDHDFMQKRGSDVHDILLDLHRVYTFDNVDRQTLD